MAIASVRSAFDEGQRVGYEKGHDWGITDGMSAGVALFLQKIGEGMTPAEAKAHVNQAVSVLRHKANAPKEPADHIENDNVIAMLRVER